MPVAPAAGPSAEPQPPPPPPEPPPGHSDGTDGAEPGQAEAAWVAGWANCSDHPGPGDRTEHGSSAAAPVCTGTDDIQTARSQQPGGF
eukprot:30979-Pleurochrysis_carterae.AAC.1